MDLSTLPAPVLQGDCKLFAVVPIDSNLKKVRCWWPSFASCASRSVTQPRLSACAHALFCTRAYYHACHAGAQKGSTLLLEVGDTGFRLLRTGTHDPIFLFPWGQIHSWAHGDCRFTFRYFDDG